MKDRITQFLKSEGISPAEFADKIGVQRSSVSHVLNGRNQPSAAFIQKFLGSYKSLNPRWLLLGEGAISETRSSPAREPSLFHSPMQVESPVPIREGGKVDNIPVKEITNQIIDNNKDKQTILSDQTQTNEFNLTQSLSDSANFPVDNKEVERIVFFLRNKTFTAYTPSK